jgi:formamidopyrimidine-DNA glycosylase
MPELPEVETMRRGIAHLAGLTITAVAFPRTRVRPLAMKPSAPAIARRLAGTRLVGVARFGKRLALVLDPADERASISDRRWLVIEPRMTGLFLVTPPPTVEHVRMEIDLNGPPQGERRLTFWDQRGLGTIRLLDARGLQRACGPAVLGPDGLVVTGDCLHERLARSKRSLKVTLLDQRMVAGIGNIYASEILHRSGLHPSTPCRRLDRDAWCRIADTARSLLAEAVRCEGSSIGDELYRTPDSRLGRFQRRHRVYGRAGEPCPRCGTAIERIVQAQRSTFFCPRCQPRQSGRRWRSTRR